MGAVSRQRLESMIEHATVDCSNEAERVTGFFTMIGQTSPFRSARGLWAWMRQSMPWT